MKKAQQVDNLLLWRIRMNDPFLTELDLDDNPTAYQKYLNYYSLENFQKVVQVLVGNSIITSLKLSQFGICAKSIRALAINPYLKKLVIHHCSVNDDAALALGELLATSETLQVFKLTSKLSHAGILNLTKGLAQNRGLEKVVLLNDKYYSPKCLSFFAELLQKTNSLKVLTVRLQTNDLIILAEGLAKNQSLKSLNLNGSKVITAKEAVTQDDFAKFAKAIQQHPNLEKLKLNRFIQGPEQFIALTEALQTNMRISQLSVDGCSSSFEGAEALANLISNNNRLQCISFYDPSIGEKGINALAEAMVNNQSIIQLNLSSVKELELSPAGIAAYEALYQRVKDNNSRYAAEQLLNLKPVDLKNALEEKGKILQIIESAPKALKLRLLTAAQNKQHPLAELVDTHRSWSTRTVNWFWAQHTSTRAKLTAMAQAEGREDKPVIYPSLPTVI